MFEGEQGAIVLSRDQGDAATGLVQNVSFQNVTVIVGVFGNFTRPGVHDLRPVGAGSPEPTALPQANCTGFWFEHASGVAVSGGSSVAFVGSTRQPFWQPGTTCWASTADSSVAVSGLACDPGPAGAE